MLCMGQKLAKTKTMDTEMINLGAIASIVQIKKLLLICANSVALEVVNFENLNFSKTTGAYETF